MGRGNFEGKWWQFSRVSDCGMNWAYKRCSHTISLAKHVYYFLSLYDFDIRRLRRTLTYLLTYMRQEINVTYTQTVQTYTHARTLRTINAKAQNPSLKHYDERTKSERFDRPRATQSSAEYFHRRHLSSVHGRLIMLVYRTPCSGAPKYCTDGIVYLI